MKRPHSCADELREAGSKATEGRLALLKVLEHSNSPLTVVQIRKKIPDIHEVTVYRSLDALVEAGLLRKGTVGRITQYEYASKPHHHHLVCSDCGFRTACHNC